MNVVNLSGTLTRNAVGNNLDKALAFTLATPYAQDNAHTEDRLAFVPCVVFQPHKELVETLTSPTFTIRGVQDAKPQQKRLFFQKVCPTSEFSERDGLGVSMDSILGGG